MPQSDTGKRKEYVPCAKYKKDIFRLRLISAKPRRIHPRLKDITDSTSADSTSTQRSLKINLSPPFLPNVVDDEGEDTCVNPSDQPQCPQPGTRPSSRLVTPRVPRECIVTPVEDPVPADPDPGSKISVSGPGLPVINATNHTMILEARTIAPEGMQSLDVPSIGGRSRAGSVTTVSSGGLLTTPSSGSIGGGSDISRASSSISFMVRERLHSLALDINRRTMVMKEHIQQPPTPDEDSIGSEAGDDAFRIDRLEKGSLYSFGSKYSHSLKSELVPPSTRAAPPATHQQSGPAIISFSWASALMKKVKINILPGSIDSQSKKYLVWLAIVSLCFLYNAYAIPLRYSFPYQTKWNLSYWLTADYLCDAIYLVDILIFKPRLRFMRDGLPVKQRKDTRKHYLCGWYFKVDAFSLLPLDLFYFLPSVGVNPLLRLPRLFKIYNYWDMFRILESKVKNSYALRIGKTLSYMVYMIHCNGCIYYSLSSWEGIASSPWTYDGRGNMYLRCFYFAAKLATSVGNNPDPTNVIEYIYMTICWMLGVFVFALLLGQIRDIVATANKNKEIFRKTMDAALDYCTALNLPKETRDKVRLWFTYTWQEQKTLNENTLLEKLPLKLQTDLAISVHYQVLSKVQLFQDCDKALLRDLVLKLKPALYLPGDYVCRKGEVGKEMYIVNKGVVEVIGGPNNDTVFATLREGSVFGEISLLALAGGNRRTADVRSKGFSNLFVLSKNDLHEAMRDYPETQRMLKRKAKKLIKSDAEKTEKKDESDLERACEVNARAATPKLIPIVAQVLDPSTSAGKLLKMVLEDEADRRKKSKQTPQCGSETSSIVDDIMSGMPIDKVIQLHQENRKESQQAGKIEEVTEVGLITPPKRNDNQEVVVVDETDQCRLDSCRDLRCDQVDHGGAVNIKVTQIQKDEEDDPDEDDSSEDEAYHLSDENRLAVPTSFPKAHGKQYHLPGVPGHQKT